MVMNYRAARLSKRQRAMLDFAVKLTAEPWTVEEPDREALRRAGFSDRDIWDIAAVAGFFNMSNRVASATDMRPNTVYHGQARRRQPYPAESTGSTPAIMAERNHFMLRSNFVVHCSNHLINRALVRTITRRMNGLAQPRDYHRQARPPAPPLGRTVESDLQRPGGASLEPPVSRLTEVAAFGQNPGNLRMFEYVPDRIEASPALVVVLHGCGQTAAGYDYGAGWSTLADRYGFCLLFPQQQAANNPKRCFNWFLPADTERDRGEACSIRQMIDAMVSQHGIDRRRSSSPACRPAAR